MSKGERFTIKRGDTLPPLMVYVVDNENQYYSIPNIAAVIFRMFDKNFTKLFEKTAEALNEYTLRYQWQEEDTDREPDLYYGEFEIVTSDGKSITVPNNGWIEIVIR